MGTNNVSDGLARERKSFFAQIMRPIMWFVGASMVLPALLVLGAGPGAWVASVLVLIFGVLIILIANGLYNSKKFVANGSDKSKRWVYWGAVCFVILLPFIVFFRAPWWLPIFLIATVPIFNDLYNLRKRGLWGAVVLSVVSTGFLVLFGGGLGLVVFLPILICLPFLLVYKKFIN
jgi:hypothetical protein